LEHSVIGVLQRVTEVLERLGIDHVVGGSLASSALGIPRSTNDADLVADVRTEHVEALVSALEDEFYADAGMIAEAIDHLGSFNLIHYTTAQKVDVFVSGTDDFRRAQIRRARQRELAGATLPFTSAEDTILAKLHWYRMGGEVSERQWKDVLEVLATQSGRLDLQHLDETARALGVADLLERALQVT